jgi:hypothetical protein
MIIIKFNFIIIIIKLNLIIYTQMSTLINTPAIENIKHNLYQSFDKKIAIGSITNLAGATVTGSGGFGTSVAVSYEGEYAVVGSPKTNAVSFAKVYKRIDNIWTQVQELQPGTAIGTSILPGTPNAVLSPSNATGNITWEANSNFGISVAITKNGKFIAVGASGGSITGVSATTPGYVSIYKKQGSTWLLQQVIYQVDSYSNSAFGTSISFDYINRLVVGAPNAYTSGVTGAVYIFKITSNQSNGSGINANGWNRPISGIWRQTSKLTPSVTIPSKFGTSVAINGFGDTIVVGAPFTNNGGVVIFTRNTDVDTNPLTNGSWTLNSEKFSVGGGSDVQYGTSVAINEDGNYIVVGAPNYNNGGGNYGLVQIFYKSISYPVDGSVVLFPQITYNLFLLIYNTANNDNNIIVRDNSNNCLFGTSVAISADGNYIAIGAPHTTIFLNNTQYYEEIYAGAIYMYKRIGPNWQEMQQVIDDDPLEKTKLGTSVSISNNGMVLCSGASGLGEFDTELGHTTFFTLGDHTPSQMSGVIIVTPSSGIVILTNPYNMVSVAAITQNLTIRLPKSYANGRTLYIYIGTPGNYTLTFDPAIYPWTNGSAMGTNPLTFTLIYSETTDKWY